MKYNINLSIIKPNIEDFRFSIDSPLRSIYEKSAYSAIHLSGWLHYKGKALDFFILIKGKKTKYSCNTLRNDVVHKFGNTIDVMCGFSYAITTLESFDFGVVIDGIDYIVATISITLAQKVLIGYKGYLFLDHDTNQSKEQFLGLKLITKNDINIWGNYFNKTKSYFDARGISFSFCLAPAKENVLASYYPYKKAVTTPVEQLLTCDSDIVYPLELLSDIGDAAYSKIDTHWSDFAALQVAEYLDNKLTRNRSNSNNFEFYFRTQETYGDLGIKTIPKTSQKILKADFTDTYNKVIYDNKVNNRGWVRVFKNNLSLHDETVVFFGDSYSINMLPYFVNKYKRVVHVFSGASLDYDIIEHEKPTKVIIQVASRFVVTPPKENFCFTSEISRKDSEPLKITDINNTDESLSLYFNKMSAVIGKTKTNKAKD